MKFKQQAEKFIRESQTRRRNPVRPQTARIYQSYLDQHILPEIGEAPLTVIENGRMREFIGRISGKKLSPSTVCQIFNVVTAVIASAVDENGNQIYPRTWNHDFIDLPVINKHDTKAEIVTPEQIEAVIAEADPTLRSLIILLAASGLRIGEALALQGHATTLLGPAIPGTGDIAYANRLSIKKGFYGCSYWDPETATIHVKSTLVRGTISPQPKTSAGNREIDLHPDVNDYLKAAELPENGFLFQNRLGNHARVETLYDQMDALGLGTGFHAFRRFRATHLEASGVPRSLTSYWLGHQGNSITDRYIKIGQDLAVRKEWALKAGLGFSLKETK
jgi:integrase